MQLKMHPGIIALTVSAPAVPLDGSAGLLSPNHPRHIPGLVRSTRLASSGGFNPEGMAPVREQLRRGGEPTRQCSAQPVTPYLLVCHKCQLCFPGRTVTIDLGALPADQHSRT